MHIIYSSILVNKGLQSLPLVVFLTTADTLVIKMSFKNREGPKVTILSNSTTFTNRFLCLRFHTSCNGNITINGTFKVKKSEQRVKIRNIYVVTVISITSGKLFEFEHKEAFLMCKNKYLNGHNLGKGEGGGFLWSCC